MNRVAGSILALVLSLSVFAGRAAAQTAPPPAERKIAVTISPVHLVLPVVELTGEYAVTPKIGVALIVGVGTITPSGSNDKFTAYEAGASFRYYALGTFRSGLQLGAEALFVKVTGEVGSVTGVGQGLAVGPFLGYKWTHSSGFTLDLQGGVAFMAITAEAGASMNEDSKVGGLVNINVGWSF